MRADCPRYRLARWGNGGQIARATDRPGGGTAGRLPALQTRIAGRLPALQTGPVEERRADCPRYRLARWGMAGRLPALQTGPVEERRALDKRPYGGCGRGARGVP